MPDIRCPKCGKKTTIRVSRTSGREYFVCLNYPKCTGQVPVEEDLSELWGQESTATKLAQDRHLQRRALSSVKSGVGTAVRKFGKAKRRAYGVIKRPGRKGRISIDKSKGEDREKPAPRPANDRLNRRRIAPREEMPSGGKEPPEPKGKSKSKLAFYRPLYKRGPGPGVDLPQEPERSKPAPYRPLFKRLKSWETVPEEQGQSEPQGREESKAAFSKPQYRRRPKPAPVLPQEPERSKPAPYRALFKRPKRWETLSEEKEQSESQGQRGSHLAVHRPLYKRGPKPAPVLPQEPEKPKPAPYRALFKRPKRWETLSEEKEQSESQGQMGSQPASYRPLYRRGLKSAPIAPQEPGGPPPPPYRALFPRAEKRRLSSGKQEPPKPRRRKAPKASLEEPRPQKAPKPAQERPQQ